MKTFKAARRLLQIYQVIAKYGLDEVLLGVPSFQAFRFIRFFNPWSWVRKTPLSRAEAVRASLEALGPIFIKLGQALSTRPDFFPEDVAQSLSILQDKVAPFDSALAVEKIERELKQPIAVLFASFTELPLASASIAQVHAATLHDGREVVVKVLRPDILKQIELELSHIKHAARLIDRYWKKSRHLNLVAAVNEFEVNLLAELDLQREGANATQLRRNFEGSSALYVPEVIWEYSQGEVLVMERIDGIAVTNRAELDALGVNIPKLAALGVEIFFTQVFRDSFFHADMHPGNIFVSKENPENPSYMCVDFGLMGSLSPQDQQYMANILYAFFNQDYRRVAQLHIEAQWVDVNTRLLDLESAVRTICEPIFGLPLHQISFAKLVLALMMTAKRFKMEVRPELMLFQKTLFSVEGLGRQLYPELDLWSSSKPFFERWLKDKLGLKAFYRSLKSQLPFYVEYLPLLPQLHHEVLRLQKAHLNQMTARTGVVGVKANRGSTAYRMFFFGMGVTFASIGCILFCHYY